MRMICPNCGAQYEVDADVIPETGRDVQCSNCGHTWFQKHAEQEAEQKHSQPAETQTEDISPPEPTDETVLADTPDGPPADPPQQQKLDEGVAGILRDEAERETVERSTESGGLESQSDLGLSNSTPEAHDHSANAQETPETIIPAATISDNSRRDLLPDIEEINSTLETPESGEDGAEDGEVALDTKRRDGFRRGFYAALFVFAIMALIYVFSPNIATSFPKLAPTLASYVDWVNALRTSVDRVLLSGVEKITALLAQLGGENNG